MENSGNLINYQNLRENVGKIQFFSEKLGKIKGKGKICDIITNETVSSELIFLELLREEF